MVKNIDQCGPRGLEISLFRIHGELVTLHKTKEFRIPEAMEDLLEAQEEAPAVQMEYTDMAVTGEALEEEAQKGRQRSSCPGKKP
jgi:hypothetical protein